MAHPVCEVLLNESAIVAPNGDVPDETGAVVDFWGVVRRTEDQLEITGIHYEAHRTMAEYQLTLLARETAERFELSRVFVQHRIGFVAAGEASLFVRIGSRHRAAAFHASIWLVDELKKRAPIWKHPRFAAAPRVEVNAGRGAFTSPISVPT